jgi:hypothetical protein
VRLFIYLFIYLKVVQNDPKLLDFGLINSLPFSKKQALAKMFLACAKVSGLIFLNLQ